MLGKFRIVFSRLRRWTSRFWPYWASAVIIAGLSWSLVDAGSGGRPGEDCWRILADCRTEVVPLEPAAAGNRQPATVLALTDYSHYMTYKIEFQGQLKATTDTNEFIAQVAQTLADNRGWVRAGYVFNRVQLAAQADFSLILVQAELLDTVPGCDSNWSCRSGRNVYINENRWNGATTAWNNAGGSLRDYRHMVVNHEVGHFLGHGHFNCSDSPSDSAPVMQQQSISLQGCRFNPWPLQFEIDLL